MIAGHSGFGAGASTREAEHLNPIAHRIFAFVQMRQSVEVPRGAAPRIRDAPAASSIRRCWGNTMDSEKHSPCASRAVRAASNSLCTFRLPPNSAINRPPGRSEEAMLRMTFSGFRNPMQGRV